MKIVMTLLAITLCIVPAQAEDLKIDWSVESGNSTDWHAMIAQAVAEAPILVAVATDDPAPSGPGVVTPASAGTVGAGVDVAASRKETEGFFKRNWGKILTSAVAAGLVAYKNRDKLGLGGSSSTQPSSSASFNQANTDNTRSQCDFRGATIGDGATIDCHDSSSRQ